MELFSPASSIQGQARLLHADEELLHFPVILLAMLAVPVDSRNASLLRALS